MIGIDPTVRLIGEAGRRDPGGDYRIGLAETLPFADDAFDLVVSHLSLIANLTSFSTASATSGAV